ncbi:MAG TPA: endonuclease Q family protein [Chitinispirillaceae bacterium]|nr:endonuclease Q family protein [Chitinispirillaceae bacterium]
MMRFIADFHIHSHYSIATSSQLVVPFLDLWGRKKGINVIGTGDAVHPGYFNELKENLVSSDNGLYKVKKKRLLPEVTKFTSSEISFVLTTEISCIYKKNGKVRKVHNLILAPSFSSILELQKQLRKIGNIESDGRPILGLDSRDLLEIVLNAGGFLIPAHIWTPWFSVLGSKSGFDSVEECYGDLTKQIFAVETGLSSDPPMNWRCSFLDRFFLVSNSDAHSPEKLGREANLFDTELSYSSIIDALKGINKGFLGTIEFFPQEGKYHLDGHQKCHTRWEPDQTRKHNGICPVCGKKVTVGVLNRVMELADSKPDRPFKNKRPFVSLTPLKNILAEILGVGFQSKKVSFLYESLISKFGPEFTILMDIPVKDLCGENELLSEGIRRLREGEVFLEGGYDGVFGSVKVLKTN